MSNFNEDILHRRWYIEARDKNSDVVYSDKITDFTFEHYLNPNGNPTIGSTCAAAIKFVTNEAGPGFLNEIKDFYGGYGNEPKVFFKIGRFKITEIEKSIDGLKTIWQGYDAMIYAFEKEYVCRILSEKFPVEPLLILEEISEQTGIEINYEGLKDVYPEIGDGTISPLPVLTYKCIYERPDGYTYRQILGYIAALAGKNATINQAGELEFIWYNDTHTAYNKIDEERIYEDTDSIDISTEWKLGQIKCTSTHKKEDGSIYKNEYIASDYTYGNGKIEIENPFMGDSIMQGMKNKILGFSSMKFPVKFIGDLRIRVGDILNVKINNKEYNIPIMHITHEWDGGVITTVESTAETDSETSIDTTGPITQSIKDTKTLIINNDTAKYLNTPSESGFKTDIFGNIIHKTNSKTDYLTIQSLDGINKFKINYETGFPEILNDKLNVYFENGIEYAETENDEDIEVVDLIFENKDNLDDLRNIIIGRQGATPYHATDRIILNAIKGSITTQGDIECQHDIIANVTESSSGGGHVICRYLETEDIKCSRTDDEKGGIVTCKKLRCEEIVCQYNGYSYDGVGQIKCDTLDCSDLKCTNTIIGMIEKAISDENGNNITDYIYEINFNDWKLKIIFGNKKEKEFDFPIAGESFGGVKTSSEVKSADGYTACPIIDGIPYYKESQQSVDDDIYVKKSGDTMTGNLVVKDYLRVGTESGTGVELAFNTEGGNVAWYAPDKTKWEFDCYNNQFRLFNYATLKNFIISKDGNVSLPGTLTIANKLNSPLVTTTHLSGNQGQAIINSTAPTDSYVMLAKMNSTNGYFTHGVNKAKYELHYTAKSTVDAGTNAATHTLVLMNEQGEASFPGNIFSDGNIKATGSNRVYAGDKVRAWTDNEGGNIEIESADGINVYQMDALNGVFRIYQTVSGTPAYFPLVIKENVIKAISLELSEALKVVKKGEIGNMLVYKDTSSGSIFYIGGVGASTYSYPHLKVTQFSNSFQILPTVSGKNTIGHTEAPFEAITAKNIYNSSGLITSSDKNKKKDFKDITQEFAGQVIDGLNPTSFRYKDGDSGRTHYGMVAQDIEKLLKELGIDSKDFAPLVKEYPKKEVENEDGSISLETDYEAEPEYFLRYEGFIGLIIKYIQGLKKENTELNNKISQMESKIISIENKLGII